MIGGFRLESLFFTRTTSVTQSTEAFVEDKDGAPDRNRTVLRVPETRTVIV